MDTTSHAAAAAAAAARAPGQLPYCAPKRRRPARSPAASPASSPCSFHAAKTSHVEPLDKLQRMLDALRASGAEKVNFAGGEPFLYPDLLGALVRHAKRESGFASVSVISNAARITRAWFEQHGADLDFLGVSCDSVDAQTNHKHGRGPAGAARAVDRTRHVRAAAALAREFGSRFKVNTVVTNSKFVRSQARAAAGPRERERAAHAFALAALAHPCPSLGSAL